MNKENTYRLIYNAIIYQPFFHFSSICLHSKTAGGFIKANWARISSVADGAGSSAWRARHELPRAPRSIHFPGDFSYHCNLLQSFSLVVRRTMQRNDCRRLVAMPTSALPEDWSSIWRRRRRQRRPACAWPAASRGAHKGRKLQDAKVGTFRRASPLTKRSRGNRANQLFYKHSSRRRMGTKREQKGRIVACSIMVLNLIKSVNVDVMIFW